MKIYTEDEIARELACYPIESGINKAGDIMRQLYEDRADALKKGLQATKNLIEERKRLQSAESSLAALRARADGLAKALDDIETIASSGHPSIHVFMKHVGSICAVEREKYRTFTAEGKLTPTQIQNK